MPKGLRRISEPPRAGGGFRRFLRGLGPPALWLGVGLLLDMGIRAVWLEAGQRLPSWGGLFLDMVGIAAVGLARGPVPALTVVVLNQVYRMALGQVSNAFTPVEVAGALFWGWIAVRRWFRWEPRRPSLMARGFVLAAAGGGAACGLAAWLCNLVYSGEWDFMPLQQNLYGAGRGGWAVLGAIPGEIALSVWDKGFTVLLAFGALALLWSGRRRWPVMNPSFERASRHHRGFLVLGLAAHLVWGGFLVSTFLRSLLTVPVAVDFLLFRQTLVVALCYLAVTTFLVLALVVRRRSLLDGWTFSLGWAAVFLSALVFFFSGLYLAANALTWSTYRSIWDAERRSLESLQANPGAGIAPEMTLTDAGQEALRGATFVPRWRASHKVLFGDLDRIVEDLFPPGAEPPDGIVEGYLMTSGGVRLAVAGRLARSASGTVLLHQEAPWLFSHGTGRQLIPTLSLFALLLAATGSLFVLLGRTMLRTTGEAVLGRKARGRLRDLGRQMEAAESRLQEAVAQRERRIRELTNLAEVGKAVGVLAHEIRNPIGTLQMAFGNLLDSLGTDPKGELNDQILIIERQIRHMNMLTQSVLAFSRGASGIGEPGLSDAGAIVESCRTLFSPAAARYGVTLDARRPAGHIPVAARENEVIQVLQNLVINAIESLEPLPPGRERSVRLSVRLCEGRVLFEVEDTGPGIPAEAQEKIFELFYTHKTQGTGLGLFVARELARLLHGDLTVVSEEGHGSRFVFELPAAGAHPGGG